MEDRHIRWPVVVFIVGYHFALFALLPIYLMVATPSPLLIGLTALLVVGGGLSITTGYHRLYSHQAYTASRAAEAPVLLLATMTAQGSAVAWAHDHRLHHRFVDGEQDPYLTNRGFWYSHLLWMFTTRPFRPKVVQDLLADPVLAFQHRHYEPCLLAVNVLIFGAVSWWTGDPFGTLVLAVLLRLFLNHHTTWFINSLAHLWGTQPYSKEHSAVNNLILAFLTWGEGYHNYHHTFSGDYRNGVYWYQFDPTKWLIWFGSKIGLTRGLRRVSRPTILRRLVGQDLRLLLDHLRGTDHADLPGLEERIRAQASRLQAKLGELKGVLSRSRRRSVSDREEARGLRRSIRQLRREIRREMATWHRLCHEVLRLQTA
jgi:stearoyl-CoA desaturase (delta-9 desaturase)